MAPKNISMKVGQPIEVGKIDVVFEVRSGPDLLGRMKISKGGIDWYPRKTRKATWEQFDAWMGS
jgi:hypothetical protein